MLKIAKLLYFCHLKKLVRPETFGPYYVHPPRLRTCIGTSWVDIYLFTSDAVITKQIHRLSK